MNTLLMRFAAPLQAWGADAKFDTRTTLREPTKSGVVGLMAAALGRKRDEGIDDLSALRFGVRVDKEAKLLVDFHMVHGMEKNSKLAYLTYRHYLADAVFLCGIEGEEKLLFQIEEALLHPAFPLSLGRRACPPEGRLCLGIRRGKSLEKALKEEPWLIPLDEQQKRSAAKTLRLILDAHPSDQNAYVCRDMPLSFSSRRRSYGFRRVSETGFVHVSAITGALGSETTHDPMRDLEV